MTRPRNPSLRGRVLVAAAAVALVGLVGAGTALHLSAEDRAARPSASPVALADETPVAKTTPTPTPTPSADAGTPAPDAPGVGPTPAPDPLAPPGPRVSTEVDSAQPGTGQPPAPPTFASLLPGGAPRSSSELGKLVAGFPAAVPIVGDSTIVSSSLDSNENTVQATVVATTPRTGDEVIAVYQKAFADLGLPPAAVQSAAGDRALAFSRGGSSVTLTVGSDGRATTYSLFAVIVVTP